MTSNLQFVRRMYGIFLNLYPRMYLEEYGEELQIVFNLSMDDATRMGKFETVRVVLQELFGLPKAALFEHLRERRRAKMIGKFAPRFDFPQGSKAESLAILAPFIVTYIAFGSMILLFNYLNNNPSAPFWLEVIIGLAFLGSIFTMFLIGLRWGLPRWFLPYLGFVLSIINIYVFNGSLDPEWNGLQFLYRSSWFLGAIAFEGLFWVGLIVLVILLVSFAAMIPRFRPFYQRLREDWTLLTFVLYGAAPFAMVLTFDEYQGEGPYVLTAYLILAVGGWFYLRNDAPWKRFWSLFVGLALSMAVAAVGKGILFTPIPGYGFTWQGEMMSTVVMWLWLALVMLSSLAMNLLPRGKSHLQTDNIEVV